MEQSSLFGRRAWTSIPKRPRPRKPPHRPTPMPRRQRARPSCATSSINHAYRYYMLDAPEITDAAFDKMLVELQKIEATYPDLVTPDSYTQRVGGYVSEQFTPVTHMARMYSMDDAMTWTNSDAWLQRTEDGPRCR